MNDKKDLQALIKYILDILIKNKKKLNIYEMTDENLSDLAIGITVKLDIRMVEYIEARVKEIANNT